MAVLRKKKLIKSHASVNITKKQSLYFMICLIWQRKQHFAPQQ